MPEFRIESLDDPRLDAYRSLKKTNHNRHHDVFIAEGVTVVERLFRSEFEVQSVLVTDAKLDSFRPQIPDDVPVYLLTQDLATRLVGYTFHQGVLAAECAATCLCASWPGLAVLGSGMRKYHTDTYRTSGLVA